jgi:hypothetical protein
MVVSLASGFENGFAAKAARDIARLKAPTPEVFKNSRLCMVGLLDTERFSNDESHTSEADSEARRGDVDENELLGNAPQSLVGPQEQLAAVAMSQHAM